MLVLKYFNKKNVKCFKIFENNIFWIFFGYFDFCVFNMCVPNFSKYIIDFFFK